LHATLLCPFWRHCYGTSPVLRLVYFFASMFGDTPFSPRRLGAPMFRPVILDSIRVLFSIEARLLSAFRLPPRMSFLLHYCFPGVSSHHIFPLFIRPRKLTRYITLAILCVLCPVADRLPSFWSIYAADRRPPPSLYEIQVFAFPPFEAIF